MLFICYIWVPANTAVRAGDVGIKFAITAVAVNKMDLREPLGGSAGRVDMMATEICPEIKRFLDWQICKILIAECNNFALSNEPSELALTGCGEFAKLDAGNL